MSERDVLMRGVCLGAWLVGMAYFIEVRPGPLPWIGFGAVAVYTALAIRGAGK